MPGRHSTHAVLVRRSELNFVQYERVAPRQTVFMATHISNSRLAHIRRSALALLTLAVLSLTVLYAAESVQYPENFRRWVHVATGVIMPGGQLPESEQGIHHVFANQKAIDSYASGDFADGAIIVYELREAQQKNDVMSEGKRSRVDVMIKDPRLYASTGGWRFERFLGNEGCYPGCGKLVF
jgi:hypothetical protein